MIPLSLRPRRGVGCAALAFVLLAWASGCGGAGEYVWFTDLPAASKAAPRDFLVHVGDTVSIRVLGHDDMTVKAKIRSDGRVAVPLIGEIEAAGKRPGSLRGEIEGRMKDYIVSPSVMFSVDDVQPTTIVLLGEVAHPGAYPLEPYVGLAQALAAGGGLTEYAQRDRIFVLRREPQPLRIRFTFDAVSRDEGRAAGFPLLPGDVVVVE
jgi:polysaccharide export outer membrane protein